jgi:hypothetical protein
MKGENAHSQIAKNQFSKQKTRPKGRAFSDSAGNIFARLRWSLMALSVYSDCRNECPLSGQERTLVGAGAEWIGSD